MEEKEKKIGLVVLTEHLFIELNSLSFFKDPTLMHCINWVAQAWKELKTTSVLRKEKELGMLEDPELVVKGYVQRNFQDEAPSGREVDVYIAELEQEFAKEEG